jgi:hypothetical protein
MTNLPQLPSAKPVNLLLNSHVCLAQQAKASRDQGYPRSARILAAQARAALEAYRTSAKRYSSKPD